MPWGRIPKALPWAGMCRAVGAQIRRPMHITIAFPSIASKHFLN